MHRVGPALYAHFVMNKTWSVPRKLCVSFVLIGPQQQESFGTCIKSPDLGSASLCNAFTSATKTLPQACDGGDIRSLSLNIRLLMHYKFDFQLVQMFEASCNRYDVQANAQFVR